MGLIPRRHRGLIYKALIFIPILWITLALMMYSDRGGSSAGNSGPGAADLSASGGGGSGAEQQHPVPEARGPAPPAAVVVPEIPVLEPQPDPKKPTTEEPELDK